MGQFGDNFILVIRVEDDLLNTPAKPFCWDMHCPCKADRELFAELEQFLRDGLLTVSEAILFYCGRTV